ncbi:N-acetylmuramoyl-L-alanine amidase [Solibacillus sp. FSL H8-0538]|uniref:N-acetylmuramoyl-L-alanine amidase n=1 Tax=Solibacillus sp. FSL H8-0538 TaxID=2921400 RepID=UPI0030F65EE6
MSFRKVSLMLAVIIMSMLSLNPVFASQRFADVPSSHGAYEEIAYLVDLNVIKGYTENGKTTFKPNASVTRGQAAKMVIVATNNKPLAVTNSSFSDVKDKELSGYVESAIKLGFFKEYSNGKFGPNVPLTRDEMSKVLSIAFNLNVEQYSKLALPFTDIVETNSYYKYIAAIYYNGIAKESIKYNASDVVTRSQFASFVTRASAMEYRLEIPVQGVTVPDDSGVIATVKATVDNLNVRSSASSTSTANILNKVNKGTTFPVYEVQENGWLKVSYNGRYAYIYKDYIQFVDEAGKEIGSVQKQVKAFGAIEVYKTRDVAGKVISTVAADETIPVYGLFGNWYLTMVNGIPGYVRISQTTEIVATPTPTPDEEKPVDNIVEEEQTIVEEVEEAESGAATEPELEQEPQKLTTKTIGRATVDNLQIREKASGSSTSLGKVARGTLVEVHSISGNWVKVTSNGVNGYINKTYLRLLNQNGTAVEGRIIVLDPGHGGKDPGTSRDKAIEKTITLKVATLVKQKLESDGAIVKMTRSGDTYPTLPERVQYAKDQFGEVFVSIHANSATKSSAKGTETYYSVTSNDNEKEDFALASAINNQIVTNAHMYNRGVKRADYVVLRGTVIPAVLVELGFVSNDEDRAKLVDDAYLEIFAQSIYNGIVKYYTK